MINNNLYLASSISDSNRKIRHGSSESRNNTKMETIRENSRYNNFENGTVKVDNKKQTSRIKVESSGLVKNCDSVVININKNYQNIRNIQHYKIEGSYNNINLSQIGHEEGNKSQLYDKLGKSDKNHPYQRVSETSQNNRRDRHRVDKYNKISLADGSMFDSIKLDNSKDERLKTQSVFSKEKRPKIKQKSYNIYGTNQVSKSVHFRFLQNEMKRSKELEFRSLFETDGIKREYLDRLKKLTIDNRSSQPRCELSTQKPVNSYWDMASKLCKPLGKRSHRITDHRSIKTPSTLRFKSDQVLITDQANLENTELSCSENESKFELFKE